jgi:flagellar biosynthesis GTPase FlhF
VNAAEHAADTLLAYEEMKMGMLKPATNKHAFAKVGIYGPAGSGKTRTAAEIAVGLHKFAKCDKPVGMFDTEPAASYIKPLFDAAGIEFLVYDESRALKDLMSFMDEAEKECSIVIVDSITHVWRDAQDSYLAKINEGLARKGRRPIYALEFHHWRPIKAAWAEFTDRFLSSKLHMVICGRAGAVYTYQENAETGKKELVTDGSRMATEKELGYEPSLLVEMQRKREDGKTINRALIEKDRSDRINGHELDFPNFESFKPHFEFLNIGGQHFGSMDQRDSKELYTEDGSDSWTFEQRQRTIYSEEIAELLKKHFPSQSADDKQKRAEWLEKIFNTRSWTKVENTQSDALKEGLAQLRFSLEPPQAEQELEDVPAFDNPPAEAA